MADGASNTVVNAFLANILNGTAPPTYGSLQVQLHTGAPGIAGTSNVAGNTTKQAAGAFTKQSDGNYQNTGAVTWTSVSTAETYSHVSLWNGATFVASGAITASPVSVGDTFTIPANGITVTQPFAS